MGPSVGLVIFYEIFYEKSIFFLRKKQIQKWQCNTLDLHIFLPKFPEFPAGARIYCPTQGGVKPPPLGGGFSVSFVVCGHEQLS